MPTKQELDPIMKKVAQTQYGDNYMDYFSLLQETAAVESDYARTSKNFMSVDTISEKHIVNKYPDQLKRHGVDPNNYNILDPKTNIVFSLLTYNDPKNKIISVPLNTLERRADFWKSRYNTIAGDGTIDDYIKKANMYALPKAGTMTEMNLAHFVEIPDKVVPASAEMEKWTRWMSDPDMAQFINEPEKDKNFFKEAKQGIIEFLKDPLHSKDEKDLAKFQNAAAIARVYDLPVQKVWENYEALAKDPKITGLERQLTNHEFLALSLAPLIGHGLLTAPVSTLVGIGVFSALDKVISLDKFLPKDVSDEVRTATELADFVAKGAVVGLAFKATKHFPQISQKLFKQKIVQAGVSERVVIPASKVRAALQGEGDAATMKVIKGIEEITGDKRAVSKAVKDGIDIVIKTEELINYVDRPWWGAFKKMISGVRPGVKGRKGQAGPAKDLLFEEAKKYKTAEEFIEALDEGQAGLYVDYTPIKRLLESNIGKDTLVKVGLNPNDTITVYRGIDDISGKAKREIVAGDYVAISRELAESYTGSPSDVVSKEVKIKDFYTEIDLEFKDEIDSIDKLENAHLEGVYNPNKPITNKQLTDIWEKAQEDIWEETSKISVKEGMSAIKKVEAKTGKSVKNVKGVIRKKTGLNKGEEPTIKESMALQATLKGAERASKRALKAGIEVGKESVREVVTRQKGRKKLKDDIKKMIKDIKDLPSGNLPVEFKEAIESIKENIDFDNLRLSKILKRNKITDQMVDEGLVRDIDDIANMTSASMDVNDLRKVHETVMQVYYQGTMMDQYLAAETDKKFAASVKAAIKTIRAFKGEVSLPEIEKAQKKVVWKELGKAFIAEQLRPELMFEMLDGMTEGEAYNVAFKTMVKADQAKMESFKYTMDRVLQILVDNGISSKQINEMVKVKGIKRELSRDELMFIYANSQNEANINHLAGSGIEEESMYDAINQLTESEKKAVNQIIDFYDDVYFDEVNDVYRKLKGVDMKKEARYFHIQNLKDVGDIEAIEMGVRSLSDFRRTGIASGSTKERVESSKAFTRFSFIDAIEKHIRNTEHYKNFALAVRDVSKFLKDVEIKDAIIDNFGQSFYNVLTDWVADIARGRDKYQGKFLDTFTMNMRSNYVMYALGTNLSTVIKQPVSFIQGAGYIGKGWAIRGLGKFAKDPRGAIKFVQGKSVQMRNRHFKQERELEEIVAGKGLAYLFSKDELGKIKQMIREGAMQPILLADRMTTTCIWRGAYDKMMEASGGDDKRAIEYADKAIRRTQPQSGLVNLPDAFRSDPVRKMLTLFRNQPNQNYNLNYEAYLKFKQEPGNGKEKYSNFARDIFYYTVAAGLLFGVVRRQRLPKDLKEVSIDLVSAPFAGLILIGDLISRIQYPWGSSNMIDASIDTAAKVVNSKKAGTKMKHFSKLTGMMLGVPGYIAAERLITRESLKTKLLGGEKKKKKTRVIR